MTKRTMETLMITMAVLKPALSLMPMTRTHVTRAAMQMAAGRGRCRWRRSGRRSVVVERRIGERVGTCMPRTASTSWKFLDHPWATVIDATAYSRIRSHPMIHAKSSPSVA